MKRIQDHLNEAAPGYKGSSIRNSTPQINQIADILFKGSKYMVRSPSNLEAGSNPTYNYGKELKDEKGNVLGKGYTTDTTYAEVTRKNVVYDYFPKAWRDELLLFTGEADNFYANKVKLVERRHRLITEKINFYEYALVFGAMDFWFATDTFDWTNPKDLANKIYASIANEMKSETILNQYLAAFASSIYGFNKTMSNYKLLKSTKDWQNTSGYASAGTEILGSTEAYDFTKYIKKYGDKKLNDILTGKLTGKKPYFFNKYPWTLEKGIVTIKSSVGIRWD